MIFFAGQKRVPAETVIDASFNNKISSKTCFLLVYVIQGNALIVINGVEYGKNCNKSQKSG